jgi:hypothetical protein
MTSLGGQHRHLVQSTVTQLNQDLQEDIYYKVATILVCPFSIHLHPSTALLC